ncbi:MAG: hypothetical protein NC417_12210 [Candidatus Gastranaerophilales bacterium]|nr:hypothetical protein [Candidatus Gastranaerophilales bacterium]
MKIEKRGSESYRIRKMYKGQMYTVSFDYKPTQKETMLAMAAELEKIQGKYKGMTFKAAADNFLHPRSDCTKSL